MNIMLIENDPASLCLLRETLDGKYGTEFNIIHLPSLPESLQALSKNFIDVVLLDLNSSDVRVLETLSCVHSVDSIVPIVVLAGPKNETLGVEALCWGAQDYLLKGAMDSNALVRALRCAVERNRFSLLREGEPGNGHGYTPDSPSAPGNAKGNGPNPPGGAEAAYRPLNHEGFAEILENERVLSFYQSWVSLKEQSIVGFEGLCRGIGGDRDSLISPTTLLRYALQHHLLSSLDRLFRRKVFEGFRDAARLNPNLVLSVNFATPTLDDGDDTGDDFLSLAREFQLDPGHIAIEILESGVQDPLRLQRFIQRQRKHGFLIALDDIGSGYSGLNRISELEPDLIKIDRSLVAGIHKKHHQQEVFKSVVRLAHGIGAQTIAEGVETEEELMVALRLGTDMVQGYYFSMPGEIGAHLWENCGKKIHRANKRFRGYIAGQINEKRAHYSRYDGIIRRMADQVSLATSKGYDVQLKELIRQHPETERLFVLDDGGAQLSLMAGPSAGFSSPKALLGSFRRGTNHSAMDYYYYHIENGFQRHTFVTEPFLSPGTGSRCVTVSTLFKNAYGHTRILCADIRLEE